jgi:hypothetical protein
MDPIHFYTNEYHTITHCDNLLSCLVTYSNLFAWTEGRCIANANLVIDFTHAAFPGPEPSRFRFLDQGLSVAEASPTSYAATNVGAVSRGKLPSYAHSLCDRYNMTRYDIGFVAFQWRSVEKGEAKSQKFGVPMTSVEVLTSRRCKVSRHLWPLPHAPLPQALCPCLGYPPSLGRGLRYFQLAFTTLCGYATFRFWYCHYPTVVVPF